MGPAGKDCLGGKLWAGFVGSGTLLFLFLFLFFFFYDPYSHCLPACLHLFRVHSLYCNWPFLWSWGIESLPALDYLVSPAISFQGYLHPFTHTHTHTIFSAFSHDMPRKTQSPPEFKRVNLARFGPSLCFFQLSLASCGWPLRFICDCLFACSLWGFYCIVGVSSPSPAPPPLLESFSRVLFSGVFLAVLLASFLSLRCLPRVSLSLPYISSLSLVPFRSTFPVFLSALLYLPHLYFPYKCAPKVNSTEFSSRV